jgi:hypothetical protein
LAIIWRYEHHMTSPEILQFEPGTALWCTQPRHDQTMGSWVTPFTLDTQDKNKITAYYYSSDHTAWSGHCWAHLGKSQAVLLKIQDFWQVTGCHYNCFPDVSKCLQFLLCFNEKTKATAYIETSRTSHPQTYHNIWEDMNQKRFLYWQYIQLSSLTIQWTIQITDRDSTKTILRIRTTRCAREDTDSPTCHSRKRWRFKATINTRHTTMSDVLATKRVYCHFHVITAVADKIIFFTLVSVKHGG